MSENDHLSDILAPLPTRSDDDVAVLLIEGRALSKNETNLHLALPTGLVAVPLDSISRVTSVPGTNGIVRLVVRSPANIRQLLNVVRHDVEADEEENVGGYGDTQRGELLGSGPGVGVSTCDYYNTETLTGQDGYDASDDEEPVCRADDEDE
jgi:hypothetical protein